VNVLLDVDLLLVLLVLLLLLHLKACSPLQHTFTASMFSVQEAKPNFFSTK
jgi:hypothetical protein